MEKNKIKLFNLNLLKEFTDYLLEKKKFIDLKNKLENDTNIYNIKNFIDYLNVKLEKKILHKLLLKDNPQIDLILTNHYSNTLIKINLFYDYNTNSNSSSSYEQNIHYELFKNYHNKKYLKLNPILVKYLKNSIKNRDVSWKTLILNGKIHFFRYTPQILLIRQ